MDDRLLIILFTVAVLVAIGIDYAVALVTK